MDNMDNMGSNEINRLPEVSEEQPQLESVPKRTIVLEGDGKESKKEAKKEGKKKLAAWQKGLIVLVVIVVCIMGLMTGCEHFIKGIGIGGGGSTSEVSTDFGHSYIGTIFVEGEINEAGNETYNHQYILNALDAMMADSDNKGVILFVNTPGGSVFASDELYLKIKEYQETTGRPVYSSMQSQATSGGYYISAPCEKIFANRNCWTGSIGVTMGSMIDVSQLLDDLGINVETITSGANKAMGSNVEPMTKEQREIFQSLVDEAYEQFVGIVAEGRDMSVAKVKKIADGRIYTAKQALKNGLIDGIATYEEAVQDMKETYDLEGCQIEEFVPEGSSDIYSLLGLQDTLKDLTSALDADGIKELVELNGTFQMSYICDVRK